MTPPKGVEPAHDQPPLTELEVKWSAIRCRDNTRNPDTEWEETMPHRFGSWSPGHDGERRCVGCDRTARMLEGPR
jgi:hypothetical protein